MQERKKKHVCRFKYKELLHEETRMPCRLLAVTARRTQNECRLLAVTARKKPRMSAGCKDIELLPEEPRMSAGCNELLTRPKNPE